MLTLHSIYYDDISDPRWTKPLSPTDYDILLLVTQGTLIYELNDHLLTLKRGDIVYIPAGTLRSAYPVKGHSHQKYSAHFTPSALELEQFPMLKESFRAETHQYDYLKQRFHLLAQQWIGQLPYYNVMCCSILQELISISCREYDKHKFPYKKLALVTILQQYILDHYAEPLRIEELAHLVDRTPNYITSTFREIVGQPPIEYLHQVRISAARDLLLNTDKSIAQIAEELGFCDQSYFNRVYRKIVGSPPSAILKEKGDVLKSQRDLPK